MSCARVCLASPRWAPPRRSDPRGHHSHQKTCCRTGETSRAKAKRPRHCCRNETLLDSTPADLLHSFNSPCTARNACRGQDSDRGRGTGRLWGCRAFLCIDCCRGNVRVSKRRSERSLLQNEQQQLDSYFIVMFGYSSALQCRLFSPVLNH